MMFEDVWFWRDARENGFPVFCFYKVQFTNRPEDNIPPEWLARAVPCQRNYGLPVVVGRPLLCCVRVSSSSLPDGRLKENWKFGVTELKSPIFAPHIVADLTLRDCLLAALNALEKQFNRWLKNPVEAANMAEVHEKFPDVRAFKPKDFEPRTLLIASRWYAWQKTGMDLGQRAIELTEGRNHKGHRFHPETTTADYVQNVRRKIKLPRVKRKDRGISS